MSQHDPYSAFAEFYDHVVPYRTRRDVDFFVARASEADGPVLEIGCGTGRILIPAARAGAEVAGVDISPAMLAICREKLAREPDSVRQRVLLLENADMRQLEIGRAFALITLPFRGFQHLLTPEDQLTALARINDHLRPDGRLIVDIFNPSLPALVDETSEGEEEPEFVMPDGRRVTRRMRVGAHDRFEQVLLVRQIYHIVHADGREEEMTDSFPMRYLFRYEAEHLLARAGFQLESVLADYDGRPYGSIYPGELVLIARALKRA
jgi:SAM-dependent methyltransferase